MYNISTWRPAHQPTIMVVTFCQNRVNAPDVEQSVRGLMLRSLSWLIFCFKNSVYFYGLRHELNVDSKNE